MRRKDRVEGIVKGCPIADVSCTFRIAYGTVSVDSSRLHNMNLLVIAKSLPFPKPLIVSSRTPLTDVGVRGTGPDGGGGREGRLRVGRFFMLEVDRGTFGTAWNGGSALTCAGVIFGHKVVGEGGYMLPPTEFPDGVVVSLLPGIEAISRLFGFRKIKFGTVIA